MGFSRQEYWSGLPCPPPGDLLEPGTEPQSPALQADSLSFEPPIKGSQINKSSCESFPHSSVGKEFACNAGDPGSTTGSGRSPGEGTGYPPQYSWASLVAQLIKNPPAIWETWIWSLGWEDPLEKGKATHSSILTWRIPWNSPWGCKESDTTERLSLSRVSPYFHECNYVLRLNSLRTTALKH